MEESEREAEVGDWVAAHNHIYRLAASPPPRKRLEMIRRELI
jgi:hypothetical protein